MVNSSFWFDRKFHIPALIIVSFAVFAATLGHDFITTWDDDKYVISNQIIRSFSTENINAAFTTYCLGNYAPLHHLSYMFDFHLFGLDPWGYHLHNIILHSLNGTLLYQLLRKTECDGRIALIASFIFLAHPVQVETVAWVSQRKTLLCMTFFLLSFLSYLDFLETEGKKFYWLSTALFAMALMAKSVVVFLPLLLLAYDLFRTERRGITIVLDKIPYLLLALLFGIVAMHSQLPQEGGGRSEYYGGTPYATFITMIPVFCRYLYNLVWPINLSADYLVPIKTSADGEVLACGALLLCIAIGLMYYCRRNCARYFWPIAAVLAILPVSQIIPLVTLMNDRYLYFPMAGLATLTAEMLVKCTNRGSYARLVAFFIGICLLSLPWFARNRAAVWSDGMTLWQDVLNRSPRNYIAMTSLGDTLRERGNKTEALQYYRQALALNGNYFIALNNISNLLLERNELKDAEGFIFQLIKKYPKYSKGFEMLGILREFEGDLDGAESAYSQALHLDPNLGESLISLAAIRLKKGDQRAAKQLLDRARKLTGDSPELLYSMACLDAQSGETGRALDYLEKAVGLLLLDAALAEKDPCFTGLREDPRFQLIIEQISGQRQETIKTH